MVKTGKEPQPTRVQVKYRLRADQFSRLKALAQQDKRTQNAMVEILLDLGMDAYAKRGGRSR